jgi:hypothetical protein
MLAVAARIPDPAARDHFADRLAHKARVTEEVVRAEIRKTAAARKTELPVERLRALSAPLRDVEKGLLWSLMHAPEEAAVVLSHLEDADFEGLRSQTLLEKARRLSSLGPEVLPAVLMERLSDQEAQLLARVASEREPLQLVPEYCVQTLKFARIERELGAIQERIDHMRKDADEGELLALLRRKNDLRTQLDRARRGSKGSI